MGVEEYFKVQLQKQWEMCQEGIRICERDPRVRKDVLEWLQEGWDRCQWDVIWWEILKGYRVANWELLMSTESFPTGHVEAGWWRQLITSSPFSLIVPKSNPPFASRRDTLGETR